MARIRILELPMQIVGEFTKTPFALVIDQVDREELADVSTFAGDGVMQIVHSELEQAQADEFAKAIGAEGAIVTSATLDVEV